MTSRPSRTQDSNSRLHTVGLRSGYGNAYGTSSQPSESVFYGGSVKSVSNRVAFQVSAGPSQLAWASRVEPRRATRVSRRNLILATEPSVWLIITVSVRVY